MKKVLFMAVFALFVGVGVAGAATSATSKFFEVPETINNFFSTNGGAQIEIRKVQDKDSKVNCYVAIQKKAQGETLGIPPAMSCVSTK